MNTIDEYIKKPYRFEIIQDAKEGGFIGFFPDLPGCITCADSLKDLIVNAEDCKKEWIEAAIESNIKVKTGH